MPRVIPFPQKQQWLQQFEDGATVARLANDQKKDPRTIQKGIEEARHRRLMNEVRVELLKEGLRRHQGKLLEVLNSVSTTLQPPSLNLLLRHPDSPPPSPLEFAGVEAIYDDGAYNQVLLMAENDFLWQLLKEHLGKNRAFLLLGRWKINMLRELNARLALRQHIATRVKYQLGQSPDPADPEDGAIRQTGLYELNKVVVGHILEGSSSSPFEVTLGDGGELLINQITIGQLSPHRQEELEVIRRLPDLLADEEPALELRVAHEEATVTSRAARESFLEIGASYYLPGTCRACSR